MEDKVKKLLNGKLDELEMFVDSVYLEKENNNLFLRICLDSNNTLDLDSIVKATNIINPIIDKADLIEEQYILEVYGKSKEKEENEKEN